MSEDQTDYLIHLLAVWIHKTKLATTEDEWKLVSHLHAELHILMTEFAGGMYQLRAQQLLEDEVSKSEKETSIKLH